MTEAERVLEFLNEKTGRQYRPTKVNIGFIEARFDEGYYVEDCLRVITIKTREWLHDEHMSKYLRPATLFNREKFNQYAGETETETWDSLAAQHARPGETMDQFKTRYLRK